MSSSRVDESRAVVGKLEVDSIVGRKSTSRRNTSKGKEAGAPLDQAPAVLSDDVDQDNERAHPRKPDDEVRPIDHGNPHQK